MMTSMGGVITATTKNARTAYKTQISIRTSFCAQFTAAERPPRSHKRNKGIFACFKYLDFLRESRRFAACKQTFGNQRPPNTLPRPAVVPHNGFTPKSEGY